MTVQPDFQIHELGRLKLALRPELVFTPQHHRGAYCYVVEDPVRAKFYRIGLPEYTLMSYLDGETTLHEAIQLASRKLGSEAFTEAEVTTVCRWLIDTELAQGVESTAGEHLAEKAKKSENLWSRLNPLTLRIPLFRPNRFFARLATYLGWVHGRAFFIVWSIVVLTAMVVLISQTDRLIASSSGIFAPHRWLWIGLCWIGLKVLHEVSHGLACQRHGGTVREAGVVLILFAPLAYVDVTSSWRFRSKWQRIHVAAAGMYAELFVAALAAFIWCQSEPGIVADLCFNVIFMAGLTAILFNANPLMRFDGYYALSDWLEIPNLYAGGQRFVNNLGRKHLMGLPATENNLPLGQARFVQAYGIASFCWRITICVGLTLGAVVLFHGAGIVLAAIAIVLWIGLPAFRIIKLFVVGDKMHEPKRLRFLLLTSLLIATIVLAAWLLPAPIATRAPAIVEYTSLAVVRTESPGFIQQIHIRSGQLVEQGQILAVLKNDELKLELADLELQRELSEHRVRSFRQKQEMAFYQAEISNQQAIIERLDEKREQAASLIVHAPTDGKVLTPNIEQLVDTYLEPGREILSIGNDNLKELQVSVAQNDFEAFFGQRGRSVRVRTVPPGPKSGILERVAPQASVTPPNPGFCATMGGDIEVRSIEDDESKEAQVVFVHPRFEGTVQLSPQQSQSLRAGQRGTVWLIGIRPSLGEYLIRILSDWVRVRLKTA